MSVRTLMIITTSVILIGAVLVGTVNALGVAAATGKATLDNVRAFAPSVDDGSRSFAVDGGDLFVGVPGNWSQVKAPRGVIVNAVTIDPLREDVVFIGAANELAIYRTDDAGVNWMRVPLTTDALGGVTAIAVDSAQRLVYVGTDTAGLFRLRDVGTSMLVSGNLLLDEPVLEVVADSTGSGLVFARTEWNLYRAEEFGMRWVPISDLGSVATAVAIAQTEPATIYVGTTDRGLLRSEDGLSWTTANAGLGAAPGVRLRIDALAVDPIQPKVLYVASSYLFGSTTLHQTPAGVAVSLDGAVSWTSISEASEVAVAELLPVSGETGSALAIMANSRMPVELGNASAITLANAEGATTAVEPATSSLSTSLTAWLVAGLSSLVLLVAVGIDLVKRQRRRPISLAPSLVEQTQ